MGLLNISSGINKFPKPEEEKPKPKEEAWGGVEAPRQAPQSPEDAAKEQAEALEAQFQDEVAKIDVEIRKAEGKLRTNSALAKVRGLLGLTNPEQKNDIGETPEDTLARFKKAKEDATERYNEKLKKLAI